MGCSASKNAVAAFDRSNSIDAKSATNSIKDKSTRESLDIATEDTNSAPYMKYRPAEAFVVSLDGNGDTSSNQYEYIGSSDDDHTKVKPLPKRLQRLMEQSQNINGSPSKNIENLEVKLAKAEQRRQQYLQQKVNSIQKLTQISKED